MSEDTYAITDPSNPAATYILRGSVAGISALRAILHNRDAEDRAIQEVSHDYPAMASALLVEQRNTETQAEEIRILREALRFCRRKILDSQIPFPTYEGKPLAVWIGMVLDGRWGRPEQDGEEVPHEAAS